MATESVAAAGGAEAGYRKPTVLFASVTGDGWVHTSVADALLRVKGDPRVHGTIVWPRKFPVEANRNIVAKHGREEPFTHVLMIDDDNPPLFGLNLVDFVLEAVEADLDIVGAVTPIWRGSERDDELPIFYNVFRYEPEHADPEDGAGSWAPLGEREGIVECDAIGTGLCLVHTRVFKEFKARRVLPFERLWTEDGDTRIGSDLNFCKRAKEMGFRVWANYNYQCEHLKEVGLRKVGDTLWKFFRRLHGISGTENVPEEMPPEHNMGAGV